MAGRSNYLGRVLSLLFIVSWCGVDAQVHSDQYRLYVNKTTEAIEIDGLLDESTWVQADRAKNFIQNFPTDTLPATSQTEIMAAFNDEYLYFAGICYENSDKEHIIASLKRDFVWPRNENLSIYFDPFNDYTNGFTFGLTPAGVQREGLVTNVRDVSGDWDNKWYSKVKDFGDRWQFEMAIPFKTIRYNADNNEWNIIFLRLDLKNNERSTWSPVPQQYRPSSLAFSGKMVFTEPLKKSGQNISFIPYVLGGASKDFENNESTQVEREFGFDAKVGVSSSLNLDLTVNPDFSNVDVDQQVTNLDRFEIFFPERRTFFLENNDLFGQNGFPRTRPFFSRRIGLARKDDDAGPVPILFGARLSGKINRDWRLGLLNMQTARSEDFGLPTQNYGVAIIQRRVFERSNVSFLFVNKETFGASLADTTNFDFNSSVLKEEIIGEDTTKFINNYNRVFGVDYNLFTADNKWQANAYYHRSINPNNKPGTYSSGIFFRRAVRRIRFGGFMTSVGENYNAELGFVPRKDVILMGQFNQLFFYPRNSKTINRHGPEFRINYITDQSWNRTDRIYGVEYQIEFLNTARLQVELEDNLVKIRNPFDPTRSDGTELEVGSTHRWRTISIEYNSDTRKLFSFETSSVVGGFFNGNRINVGGRLNYRYQPYANISIDVNYNDIQLPDPFNDARFWLIGPKVELTFTDKVFWTTFIQWNDQSENININARLQWRFKPASDMFLVYTDDYFPDNFSVKNRAIVFKLAYWFNF